MTQGRLPNPCVKTKRKGSRAELKTIRRLEADGYLCTKAGGSLGLFDIIAIGPTDIKAIQVKAGTARLSRAEREAMTALVVPEYVSVEYWQWRDYAREPVVDVIPSKGVEPDTILQLGGSQCEHTNTHLSLR